MTLLCCTFIMFLHSHCYTNNAIIEELADSVQTHLNVSNDVKHSTVDSLSHSHLRPSMQSHHISTSMYCLCVHNYVCMIAHMSMCIIAYLFVYTIIWKIFKVKIFHGYPYPTKIKFFNIIKLLARKFLMSYYKYDMCEEKCIAN